MEERHYYHAATKGLEDDVLFICKEHFVAGMNRVGFCRILVPGVIVIAFVLMDNHVHFILYGTYSDCMNFMSEYRRLTEIWLLHNCPEGKKKAWAYDCWMIPNKEKLQEKICYVLRNPLSAGMNVLPTSYCWGSGPLMFSGKSQIWPKIRPIGEMTVYATRKFFGTKLRIPSDWMMTDDGLIWPGSYVDYRRAEMAFGGIIGFMYEQNRKNEDLINQEMYGSEISISDSDAIAILVARSESEFGMRDLQLLTIPQRLDLCRLVRKSHGINYKQLGRILHIKSADMKKVW